MYILYADFLHSLFIVTTQKSSYQTGIYCFTLVIKRQGRADGRSPPPTAEVKNALSSISTPSYATMVYTGTKLLYSGNRM